MTHTAQGPWQRLIHLARPQKNRLILGTIFLTIGSGLGLLYPQAVRIIIDDALGNRDLDLIKNAALGLIAVFALQGVAIGMRAYLFTIAGEHVVTTLRNELFQRIVGQELAFFDENKTGELTSRLASDTQVLQNAVGVNISMGLRFLASGLGALGLLFWTSWQLTLEMLMVVPPLALGTVWVGRKIRVLARRAQDALAEANDVAEESLANMQTVRTFGTEIFEGKRYANHTAHAFDLAKERARASASFMGGASFVGYAAVVWVLWSGGNRVIEESLSIGALTSFVLYTLVVAFSLGALAGLYTDFMKAIGATQRIFGLIERVPKQDERGRPISPRDETIVFKDVGFAYPTRPDIQVLQDFSLELKPGKVTALVGSSGSGKSTVAALLARLYDPTTGAIVFGRDDIRELDAKDYRAMIGFVGQEPVLFSGTIRENLAYGRHEIPASDSELEKIASRAHVSEFIERFSEGWETKVGERGVQLSGGQKQRIAIARALLRDPKILILDEATSALDARSEQLVQEALDELMVGRTTLIIAHRLSTVANADEVIVLDNGRILERGTHAELLRADGPYKALVESQLLHHGNDPQPNAVNA